MIVFGHLEFRRNHGLLRSETLLQMLQSRLICLLLLVAASPSFAQDSVPILVKAKHVYSEGMAWGEPAQILIRNGKIESVGATLEVDGTAKVLEVDSLMPGLINAFSRAGLSGGTAEVSREVTPEFDTYSAIDWRSRDFLEAIDEGVTTLQIVPQSESVFAGLTCLVKSFGPTNNRTLQASENLVLSVCSDPASRNRSRSRPEGIYMRQPTNRMGVVWIIRSTLQSVKADHGGQTLEATTRAILSDVMKGQRKTISISRTDFDIRSSLDLGDEFHFKPVIYGGDEVYRIIDEFKSRGGKLVYTALARSTSTTRGEEGTGLRWNVPGLLIEKQVPFCLAGDALLDQARFAVRFGLTPQQGIAAITQRPAEILGIQNRIGSIAVGNDADLVCLNGDPIQPTSAILWTMVNGNIHERQMSRP